jgi:hypothetical protein
MKGSFWWKVLLRLLDTYKGIAKVDFGTGDTILLWTDLWNGLVLQYEFPIRLQRIRRSLLRQYWS